MPKPIFLPLIPANLQELMEEFLYHVDPAKTGCVENEMFDEYEALAEAIAARSGSGYFTHDDWVTLTEETFGDIPWPFGEENTWLLREIFKTAIY